MSRTILTTGIGVLLAIFFAFPAAAQRGRGDDVGIVRQGIHPELQRVEGNLVEIKIGPCEATTGRARIGAHLIVETSDSMKVNLHLGPARFSQELVSKLEIGQTIAAEAFRTDKLATGDMIAVRLELGNEEVILRDDSYRPTWASGGGRGRGNGPGFGRGNGRGRGPGYGRGVGSGREGGDRYPFCQGWGYALRWGVQDDTPSRLATPQTVESSNAQ